MLVLDYWFIGSKLTAAVLFFSGHDFTLTYGETQFVGNLTPRIHSKLRNVRNCIFDGEMCGYDEELQVFGQFSMTL